jgi:hypothetical protein
LSTLQQIYTFIVKNLLRNWYIQPSLGRATPTVSEFALNGQMKKPCMKLIM